MRNVPVLAVGCGIQSCRRQHYNSHSRAAWGLLGCAVVLAQFSRLAAGSLRPIGSLRQRYRIPQPLFAMWVLKELIFMLLPAGWFARLLRMCTA